METQEFSTLMTLSEEQRQYVLLRKNDKKSLAATYLLWGILGAHYFYLGRPIINLLYWITLGGFGIWMLIDAFRIPGMVRRYNDELFQKYVLEAKQLYPTSNVPQ